jgi:hypothetical protein
MSEEITWGRLTSAQSDENKNENRTKKTEVLNKDFILSED